MENKTHEITLISTRMATKFLVFISLIFVFFSVSSVAQAASLYFSPSSNTYFLGRTFNVTVYVSSADAAMNAAQGTVSFPTDKIEVISLSKSGSAMNLWVQEPSFSNRDGIVNFAGVVTNPGFQGGAGKIITITFRANALGKATLSFLSGSILANDGNGTNILSLLGTATINITESPEGTGAVPAVGIPQPVLDSTPPINSVTWFNIDSIQFNWKIPQGVDGVEYAISDRLNYQFSKISQGAVSQAPYDLRQLKDGTWYFSVHFKKGGDWGPAVSRALLLDRTSPEPFSIIRESSDLTVKQPVFKWGANDETSGIAYYEIKIGEGDWFDASGIEKDSAYVLPPQSPARSRTLLVRAYDNAGNFKDSSIKFDVIPKTGWQAWWYKFLIFLNEWGWLLLIAVTIILLALYFMIFRLVFWRRSLRIEIQEFKNELRRDLKRLEGQLKSESEKGMEIDLRPSHLEKTKESLQKEIKHIEDDVKEELKEIEKFTD